MSYAEKTFEDRSLIKRYFQGSRLRDALRLAEVLAQPRTILDFGAGNGELCKRLAKKYPLAHITCYEPHPDLLAQARANLEGVANIAFADRAEQLPPASADLLFCLEVFEHLPREEFGRAMRQLEAALGAEGLAIIGVPVETGLPALYKGIFRAFRRRGEFDARALNILSAVCGRPPVDRPVVELLPGSWFHLHHLGFDHRRFARELASRFELVSRRAGPVPVLGTAFNPEVSFAVRKGPGAAPGMFSAAESGTKG